MKKYIAFAVIAALTFCSCARTAKKSTFDVLCELIAYSGENEDGIILYSSTARLGELGYIDDSVKRTLYGEKYVEECFPLMEEYAISVSGRYAGEIAVFKCYSRSDTDVIAQMCLERADLIKVALSGTELEEKSRAIRTEIHGRYVLFSFSDHSDKIAEYFLRLV